MAQFVINDRTVIGDSIIIDRNKVYVNGKDVTPDAKKITIYVEGNINQLQVDVCENVIVNGDVDSLVTTSGDVTANEIKGNVRTTSGDVECSGSCGSVQTVSGDVKADSITGSVKTVSGDISSKSRN